MVWVRSVGAEGEEPGIVRDLVGRESRPGDFDHRTEFVGHLHALFVHHPAGLLFKNVALVFQFVDVADERNHDFGLNVDAFPGDFAGRFEDGPHLHGGQFGHQHSQPHPAQAQHGVFLPQAFHPFEDPGLFAVLLQKAVDGFQIGGMLQANLQIGELFQQIHIVGQEFVQGEGRSAG